PSLVHQRDLGTGGADVLDQVGADNRGGTSAQVPQERPECHTLLRVKAGGWPIQQQQLRLVDDNLRYSCPAQLSAGQRPQLRLSLGAEVDHLNRGRYGWRNLRPGHLLQQREVLDELEHRETLVIAEVLRQVAEPAPDLPPRAMGLGVTAKQPQLARH